MASGSYKKISTKVSAPRKTASGLSKMPHARSPSLEPLKTRVYTKGILKTDPSEYGSFGFGDTGVSETPSLLGMAKSGKSFLK